MGLAKAFMSAYPVLAIDQFSHPNTAGAEQWQSAMTYKRVGTLQGLTNPKPFIMKALAIGIGIGLITEILRKAVKGAMAYRIFVKSSRKGRATDFLVDAVFLPRRRSGVLSLARTFDNELSHHKASASTAPTLLDKSRLPE